MAIRLLLADDQPLLRSGFRSVLGGEPDLTVVGEAGDGDEAFELAQRLRPDVVLMDIRMPRRDGLATTAAIVAAKLPVRVLILTTFDLDDYVVGAIRAGASGFLTKDVSATDLIAAIRLVAAGEVTIPPKILRRLLDRIAHTFPDPVSNPTNLPHPLIKPDPSDGPVSGLDTLTEREREVLIQVARGLSNVEIATVLRVSETTVKTHVGRVLTKLGLRDRVQAVVLAYESGLIRPRM